MKLYFASSNDHKKTEMERLLPGFSITLPKEEGLSFSPEETGETYIENAIIKAKALYQMVKTPVIADDSGLEVDALEGKPGVHTARFGEVDGIKLSDREKYMLLLEKLKGKQNRKARFICAIVLYFSPQRIYVVQEVAEGKISDKPEGEHGFGYDPVFYNNEAGQIVALLPEGDKDYYSHRGKAARKLLKLVEDL